LTTEPDKIDTFPSNEDLKVNAGQFCVESKRQIRRQTNLATELFIHKDGKHILNEYIPLLPDHVRIISAEFSIPIAEAIVAVRCVATVGTLRDFCILLDEKLVEGIMKLSRENPTL